MPQPQPRNAVQTTREEYMAHLEALAHELIPGGDFRVTTEGSNSSLRIYDGTPNGHILISVSRDNFSDMGFETTDDRPVWDQMVAKVTNACNEFKAKRRPQP